ncbi:hypothetical protein E4P24_02810 [Haloferax sp. AS1]|uniref:hypothetical protein n=1 Tax=Haloferax sp. AS1 TaxID=2562277 RepID=UPI00165EE6BE|nr:hypothetical protein [Haloferax sp. AS1]MBC9985302.1 hypothetical protein [Haloferax sp. AS1]
MALPSWTVSGVLALLLGLYVANHVRGEEHGANQPQDPKTKQFISKDNDFWRWLLSGVAIAGITAYFVPKVTPTVNTALQNTSPLGKLLLGVWGLIMLKGIYKKFG